MTRAATVEWPALERRYVTLNGVVRTYVVIPDYQVSITPGEWHRRGSIANETACGLPIKQPDEDRPYVLRDYSISRGYILDDKLCSLCHTPHELRLGIAAQKDRESQVSMTPKKEI